MGNVLKGLVPERVFSIFELLSSVPHGSGNTKAVSDLCVGFARERGLEYVQDGFNNVIIKKPASAGYEDRPPVILQAHLDMVCAVNPDRPVDMSREPVKLVTDGEYVWADGTSLGADDMIGVACALALLDDGEAAHPPLEVLLTTDEETGMYGASGLDVSALAGKRLINLDSEDEGVITAGCAGGLHLDSRLELHRRRVAAESVFYRLCVSGLLGGHSGAEIDRERGNSNLIAARIIREASEAKPRLCSFEGGVFDNVIPSETLATFAVPREFAKKAEELVRLSASALKDEYAASEPGLEITLEKTAACASAVTFADTLRAATLLLLLPNGVMNMNIELPGLVETSLSTGIAKLDGSRFGFTTFIRSSSDNRKQSVFRRVRALIEDVFGGTVKIRGNYPAWRYRSDSELLASVKDAYFRISGKEAVVFATHGGLECGIFCGKIPGLDCVSIGPDMSDIHSVNERLNVASVGRFYELLRSAVAGL